MTSTSGIITTGTRNIYGLRSQPASTAASTGGTTNVYGAYLKSGGTVGAGGTINAYGLYVANDTMNTTGTSTNYGLYVEALSGADQNVAAYFGGNVGIGRTNPQASLEILSTTIPQFRTAYSTTVYSDFNMTSAGDLVVNVDGATNQLVLDANHTSIGIGTSVPSYTLDVAGSIHATSFYADNTLGASSNDVSGMIFRDGLYVSGSVSGASNWTDATTYLRPADNSGEQNIILGSTADDNTAEVKLSYSGNSWFTGGNVGIGTTAPGATLGLASTSPTLRMTDTTGSAKSLLITTDLNLTQFEEVGGSANDLFVLDLANSRVGIGTTNPGTKLVINGSNDKGDGYYWNTLVSAEDWDYSTVGVGLVTGFTAATGNASTIFMQANSEGGEMSAPLALNPKGGNVGIGTTAPTALLSIAGTADKNVYLFYDNDDVGDTTDGQSLYLYRRAAEFDRYFRAYIDQYGTTQFDSTGNLDLYSEYYLTQNADEIYLQGNGEPTNIGSPWMGSGDNPVLKQYGWNTAASTEKYIQWQINDTTDNFELTREDSNVGYFDIQMPTLITGGNVGIGTTNPLGKLHVNVGTDQNFRVSSLGSELYLSSYNDANNAFVPMQLFASEYNFNSGNVGIGTTNPLARLAIADTNQATHSQGNLFISTTDALAINKGGQISLGGNYTTGENPTQFAGIAGRKENGTEGNAAGYLALSTSITAGGTLTEQMRINSSGNVGIGTTAPGAKLSLGANAAGANSAATKISLWENGSAHYGIGLALNASTYGVGIYSNDGSTGTPKMFIEDSGNVGIGTTGPVAKLTINDTNQGYSSERGSLLITDSTNTNNKLYFGFDNVLGTYGSGYIQSVRSGTDSVPTLINPIGGNVGIGTTDPGEKLEVVGNIRLQDNSSYYLNKRTDSVTTIIQTSRSDNTQVGLLRANGWGNFSTDYGFGIGYDLAGSSRLAAGLYVNGNVGIGTTNPLHKLDVSGNIGIAASGYLNFGTTDGESGYGIRDNSGNIEVKNSGGAWAGLANLWTDTGTLIYANNYPSFAITDGGNIGIGTTAPGSKLEIAGASSVISNSSGAITITPNTNLIVSSGNVGIGNTNPGSKLTVNGVGSFTLGTVGLPGIIFGTDTNTGMWSSAGDTINFSNNGAETLRITSGGNVGIGNTNPSGPFIAKPPATQTIAGGDTITADACGTVKRITAAGAVTTNTTDTFTAPSASNEGCVMQVVNVSSSQTITLDANTNFKCGSGTNKSVGPYDALTVFSDGTYWYMAAASVAANSDLAEWYMYSGAQPTAGDLVSASDFNLRVSKTAQAYDQKILGIVSTNPAITLGPSSEQAIKLALSGRVPAKVIVKNDSILVGDDITSSSITGFGMKALKPGQVVGKALESTANWNEQNCPAVPSLDNIFWPEDDGTNSAHPCYRLPDGSYVGKIMVFVNLSWADPDIYLTDTGEFNITQSGDDYLVANQNNGRLVDRVSAFSQSIIGELRAGSINSRIIDTQVLKINGQTINDYIAGIVNTILEGSSQIIGSIGDSLTVNQLTVEEKLLSPIVEADQILTDQLAAQNAVTQQLTAQDATITDTLKANNADFNNVTMEQFNNAGDATISGELNANSINSENIETKDASISGTLKTEDASVSGQLYADSARIKTLTAEKIKAGSIEGLEAMIGQMVTASISAQQIDLKSQPSPTATPQASASAQPSLPADWEQSLDQLMQRLDNVEEATAAGTWSTDGQLTLDSQIMLGAVDTDLAMVNTFLGVLGTASIVNLQISNSLTVQDSLTLGRNSLSTLDDTLYLQPNGLGKVEILAGAVVIESNGNLTVNGDLYLQGNLYAKGINTDSLNTKTATVSGSLFANLIETNGKNLAVDLGAVNGASDSASLGSKFQILNSGQEVASIDASGSAKLNKLIIAGAKEATSSGVVGAPIDPTVTSNATAGTATLPAGEKSLTIQNSNVTPGSLVYITPASDTGNTVLYISGKVPVMDAEPGSFTVSVNKKTNSDIQFNWWIIN